MEKMKFEIEKGVLMHYKGTEKEVVIPEGIRVIAPKAFLGSTVTAVHIPDSVREIAHHAFMGCKGLTEVLLPASVAKIGNHAFCGCTNLKKVTYKEEALRWVGTSAFEGTPFLDGQKGPVILGGWLLGFSGSGEPVEELVIPEGVTAVGHLACSGYQGAPRIGKIVFGDAVTYIGHGSFEGQDVAEIWLGAGVRTIAGDAFRSCENLAKVHHERTEHPIAVGVHAFQGTQWETQADGGVNDPAFSFRQESATLLQVQPDEGNGKPEVWKAGQKVLLSKETWEGLCKKRYKKGSSLEADRTVQSIMVEYTEAVNDWRFSVIMAEKYPDAVEYVLKDGQKDFQTIGGILYTAGDRNVALAACPPGLENCRISDGVVSILPFAFYQSKISRVTLPDSLAKIGDAAFCECDSLTELNIPDSVRYIGEDNCKSPCDDCRGLTAVNVGIQNPAFFSVDSLLFEASGRLLCCPAGKEGAVSVPDFCSAIGKFAFSGCRDVTDIHIPAGVTGISKDAFYNCELLEHIYLNTDEAPWADDCDPFDSCPRNLCIHGLPGGSLESFAEAYGYSWEART